MNIKKNYLTASYLAIVIVMTVNNFIHSKWVFNALAALLAVWSIFSLIYICKLWKSEKKADEVLLVSVITWMTVIVLAILYATGSIG